MLAHANKDSKTFSYLIRINHKIIDFKEDFLRAFVLYVKMIILYNNGIFHKDLQKYYNFVKNSLLNVQELKPEEQKLFEQISNIEISV